MPMDKIKTRNARRAEKWKQNYIKQRNLYRDPHVGITNLHGFRHPQRALENAEKEYNLTPRERDIIVKHMWPLTVLPPTCREAWIVTTADKWCSLLETFRILKGHGAKRKDKTQQNE